MVLRMNPLLMGLMQAFLYGGMSLLPILILKYSLLDEFKDRLIIARQHEVYDFIIGKESFNVFNVSSSF